MGLPVVISETAFKTFESICAQIHERLGPKAVSDFKKNTIKTLELISNSPFVYKETEFDPNIRQGLIKKISSVFYEIKTDRIEVLFFWDNRQEPMFF
jgi:plasmid stabilization system protein ParE